MEDFMEHNTIYVNMLGRFSISLNGKSISDYNQQSKKTWNLLEYLITFRNKEISTNDLVELLWGDETSNNPGGALKTLLFRVRQLLIPLDYPPQDLIVQQRGSYTWTRQLKTIIDTDQFESLCAYADAPDISEDIRLSHCLDALYMYKGDFLPKSEWESWVIPISAYYHSLYQKTVHKVLDILSARQDYRRMIDVCQKALAIEAFDEDFHYHLINSLYCTGDQHGAIEHYNHTLDMFYNEFAITPSERLKELYKTIRDKKHGITVDLNLIHDYLMEAADTKGAFLCEPAIFKDIYQLESRAIERTGDSIYLCLLTATTRDGNLPESTLLTRVMRDLGDMIHGSLRRGDIYSRYSLSQYIILLPSATFENGELVLQRIIRNLKKHHSYKDIAVAYSLQTVPPSQSEADPYMGGSV